MIDIESLIVDKVNTAVATLKTTYPNLNVVGDYIERTENFPCVSVVQSDNYSHLGTRDAALVDHAVNVSYEINVFANDKKKKSTAKKVAAKVDECMLNNLFTRTFMGQTPNVDRTVYRITMRYTAVVAAPVVNGNTVTYQMYRD